MQCLGTCSAGGFCLLRRSDQDALPCCKAQLPSCETGCCRQVLSCAFPPLLESWFTLRSFFCARMILQVRLRSSKISNGLGLGIARVLALSGGSAGWESEAPVVVVARAGSRTSPQHDIHRNLGYVYGVYGLFECGTAQKRYRICSGHELSFGRGRPNTSLA